jgi:hypothetical protein
MRQNSGSPDVRFESTDAPAHAEIEAEDSFGRVNGLHQSAALQCAALVELFAALSVKHLQN